MSMDQISIDGPTEQPHSRVRGQWHCMSAMMVECEQVVQLAIIFLYKLVRVSLNSLPTSTVLLTWVDIDEKKLWLTLCLYE